MSSHLIVKQLENSNSMTVNISGDDDTIIRMVSAALRNDDRFAGIILSAIIDSATKSDDDDSEIKVDINLN